MFSHDPPADQPRAPAHKCPRCGNPGVPRSVLTDGPHRVIIELRCLACQHVWTETRPTPKN